LPDTITVNSTRLALRFNSDGVLNGRGFYATYRAYKNEPECKQYLYTVEGSLSPTTTSTTLTTHSSCTWIIVLPSSFQITFKYQGSIPSGNVTMTTPQRQLTTFTGNTSKVAVRTLSNILTVKMEAGMGNMFNLTWSSVDKDLCGGDLRATAKPGTIYSHHNFNNTDLPSYQSCRWTITARPKHRIVLSFLEFDINGSKGGRGRKCKRNYLEIKDNNRRLGRYCTGRNAPKTIVSRTNVLDIRLNTKKLPGKGFTIKYSKL